MAAAASRTQTITVKPDVLFQHLTLPLLKFLQDLKACKVIDQAAKIQIEVWEKDFQESKAVSKLCYLLFKFIRPLADSTEKQKLEAALLDLLKSYLPANQDLKVVLARYEKSFALYAELSKIEALFAKLEASFAMLAQESDQAIEAHYKDLRGKILAFKEQATAHNEAFQKQVKALESRFQGIALKQLEIANKAQAATDVLKQTVSQVSG